MSEQPPDREPKPVTVPPDEAQFTADEDVPAFTVQAGLAAARASAQGLSGEEE